MLGIVLLYFIGKKFYDLAQLYSENKWLWAVLGIVAYYLGAFLLGINLSLIEELTGNYFIEDMPNILLGLIALPFGLLSCYILYYFLKRYFISKHGEKRLKTDFYRD